MSSILDGSFSHLFVIKIKLMFLKAKINREEAEDDLFKKDQDNK